LVDHLVARTAMCARHSGDDTMRVLIAVLSVALFFAAACNLATPAPTPAQAIATTPIADLPVNVAFQPGATPAVPTAVPQAIVDAADAEYLLLTNIYERVAPSVVNIEVVTSSVGFADVGRGSGFVLDTEGHIITNAHVINDASEINVTFNDGYVAEARADGIDLFSDLAVLSVDVDSSRLFPVTIADSDAVRVGERAIAIGNPFGLASSMTVGIVSGLGRQLPSAELIDGSIIGGFNNPSIIQVDTDVNPGNSGGPLLNSHGEVIGVTTAIRTESGVFQGVGFAVPSRTVQRVVPELIASGRVEYSWIGISTLASEDGFGVASLAEPLSLPVTAGVLITAVMPDSPASKAGLLGGDNLVDIRGQPVCAGGDIIVAVNGQFVDNMDELVTYLVVNTKPGDTVNVLVVRAGETFELPVVLEPRPTDNLPDVRECGR
jgi:S1-C subfamily serine protease